MEIIVLICVTLKQNLRDKYLYSCVIGCFATKKEKKTSALL